MALLPHGVMMTLALGIFSCLAKFGLAKSAAAGNEIELKYPVRAFPHPFHAFMYSGDDKFV